MGSSALKGFLHILGASVLTRVASAVAFVVVARYWGAADAGRLSLGTTFATIFIAFSSAGLDELLVRGIAKTRERAADIFWHAFVLRGITGPVAYVGIVVVAQQILHYSSQTLAIILILGLAICPDTLSQLCQNLFIALSRTRYLVFAAVLSGTADLLVIAWTIWSASSLESLVQLWVILSPAVLIVHLVLVARLLRSLSQSQRVQFSGATVFGLVRQSPAFLLIILFIVVEREIDIILLSLMRSEIYVGWYEAANTLLVALSVIPYAFGRAIFPLMAMSATDNTDSVGTLYSNSLRVMVTLGLGTGLAVICGAPIVVTAIYGASFAPAVAATQVLAWTLIMTFVTVPHVRLLLARSHQREVAVFLAISMTTDVLLNVALVPSFGIVGTALARAGAASIFFTLTYGLVRKKLIFRSLGTMVPSATILATMSLIAYGLLQSFGAWVSALGAIGLYVIGVAVLSNRITMGSNENMV